MKRQTRDCGVVMSTLERRVLLAAAPVLVKDFSGAVPTELVDVNGTLYFKFEGDIDNLIGDELWRSDGSDGGTLPVASFSGSISHLTNANGTLYFFSGLDLWKSDGSGGGTTLVKADAAQGAVKGAVAAGGRFYYWYA